MKIYLTIGIIAFGFLGWHGDIFFPKKERRLCALFANEIIPIESYPGFEYPGLWLSSKYRDCLFTETIQKDYNKLILARRKEAHDKKLEDEIAFNISELPNINSKFMKYVEIIGIEKFKEFTFTQETNSSAFYDKNLFIKVEFDDCSYTGFLNTREAPWHQDDFRCRAGDSEVSLKARRFRTSYAKEFLRSAVGYGRGPITLFVETIIYDFYGSDAVEYQVAGLSFTEEDIRSKWWPSWQRSSIDSDDYFLKTSDELLGSIKNR